MNRERKAGWQHVIGLTLTLLLITELVGVVGWAYWTRHPEFHECNCS